MSIHLGIFLYDDVISLNEISIFSVGICFYRCCSICATFSLISFEYSSFF